MTKQEIVDAFGALDAELTAVSNEAQRAARDAVESAIADCRERQRAQRSTLQEQCDAVGGHVFRNSNRCDICGYEQEAVG